MRRLDGKAAPITGSARGIGKAFAETYIREGATVAIAEGLAPGDKKNIAGAGVPFGRMAKPEELAGLAVFLASEEANYIVAQTYNVDGGQWMS
ncbi:SDR family oxidoreductase [Pseudoruegeria sp. M32A2M]|nr:SDR family oxidoreductase [Pseudoruegeria sp. M32A2M]